MAGNKITIRLTDDQQNQIKNATGRSITEVNIDVAATGRLTEKDLDKRSWRIHIRQSRRTLTVNESEGWLSWSIFLPGATAPLSFWVQNPMPSL